MSGKGKVIITCAVTGAIHTPTMSPYLPITADEIIEQSLAAAAAGASILHLHARDEKTGRPDQDSRGLRAIPARKSSSRPTPLSTLPRAAVRS